MSSDPPAPLIPPGTNLRSFPFMPLDVTRLRESDLAAIATGDEFRAAMLLWCAAWPQIPAGSLPDDDKTLAYLAGFGRNLEAWSKCRAVAMRGFILCSDSRLYHPVICEKVIDALARIEAGRTGAKSRWQKKKLDNSGRNASGMPRASNAVAMPHGGNAIDKDTDKDKDKVPPQERKPPSGAKERTLPLQSNRGTRLPENWTLPDEWLQWAIDQNLAPLSNLKLEGDRFRDYWWAKAGKDATKRDWFATWRNWTRRAVEITKQHSPTASTVDEPSPRALAQWRQAKAKADEKQQDASSTGQLRSQQTPAQRRAFERKIAKLRLTDEPVHKPQRQAARKQTPILMTPEEREAGLVALAKGLADE